LTNRKIVGAPGEIRTPDLLVRSQALYPTELRARFKGIFNKISGLRNNNFRMRPGHATRNCRPSEAVAKKGAHPITPVKSRRKLGRNGYTRAAGNRIITNQGGTMLGIPLRVYGLFFASVAFQLMAMMLLPRTRGFTVPLPTAGCALLFICGIWMVARMYQSGAKLGIMSPLLAAVIPLGVIAIGIFLYDESTSPLRVGLLLGACALIGAAAAVP
jgi:multidrug transporter EmrE-like cation transporter